MSFNLLKFPAIITQCQDYVLQLQYGGPMFPLYNNWWFGSYQHWAGSTQRKPQYVKDHVAYVAALLSTILIQYSYEGGSLDVLNNASLFNSINLVLVIRNDWTVKMEQA